MRNKRKVSVIILLGVLLAAGSSLAEKKAPTAFSGSMMLEHVGMECSNCHGANGPKGVKMGNHPGQKCTDCHDIKSGMVKPMLSDKKIPLGSAMMLEHIGIECATCHGQKGPAGVDMSAHPGQKCTDCHELDQPAK